MRDQLKVLESRPHRLSWDFLPPLETDPSLGMQAQGPTAGSARPLEEGLVLRAGVDILLGEACWALETDCPVGQKQRVAGGGQREGGGRGRKCLLRAVCRVQTGGVCPLGAQENNAGSSHSPPVGLQKAGRGRGCDHGAAGGVGCRGEAGPQA